MMQPRRLPHGPLCDLLPETIVGLMTPHWRAFISGFGDGDFARPYVAGKTLHVLFDSAVRRALIAPLGFHVDGKWQYRLTLLGRRVRDICIQLQAGRSS